jgi:hypothetical protein
MSTDEINQEADEINQEAEELIKSIIESDEGAKARYYATIFDQLQQFEDFIEFVYDRFVIIHEITEDEGLLNVVVKRIEEVLVEKESENGFAEALQDAQEKDELHPSGRCVCGGEGKCDWCNQECPDCKVKRIIGCSCGE